MTREILFRGQTRRYGEKLKNVAGDKMPSNWVYGGIFAQNKGGAYSIIYTYDPLEKRSVYADTVGQFTGLYDSTKWEFLSISEQQEWLKNHTVNEWKGKRIFEGDLIRNQDGDIGRVTWYPEYVAFMIYCLNKNKVYFLYNNDCSKIEVIGNVHDNPEILQEAKT